MRNVRALSAATVVAMALTLLLPGAAGAQAPEAAATCQLIGIVGLSGQTDLRNATQGSGSFTPLGAVTCEGAVDGVGSLVAGGGFSFCGHNEAGTPAACHPVGQAINTGGENQTLLPDDSAYDAIAASPAPVAADFKVAPTTFGPFAQGGNCTLVAGGHAIGAQAEIVITSFTCAGGPVTLPAMKGAATATAVPVIEPCVSDGAPTCFDEVTFIGHIEVHSI